MVVRVTYEEMRHIASEFMRHKEEFDEAVEGMRRVMRCMEAMLPYVHTEYVEIFCKMEPTLMQFTEAMGQYGYELLKECDAIAMEEEFHETPPKLRGFNF